MKRYYAEILRRVGNPKHLLFAALSALLLTVLCYFANNLPIFTSEDLHRYLLTQKTCEWLGFKTEIDYSDAFFLNTAFDKELVPAIPSDTNFVKKPLGEVAITDRKKLYLFLKFLNESKNYKYVILDIKFCKEEKSEYDDSLFNLIEEMDRIVIPVHDDMKLARKSLEQKAALAHYYATIIETNFVRYEFTRDTCRYIPTKVYEDLFPERKIEKQGWRRFAVYVSDGKLVNNSCFVTFDGSRFNQLSDYVGKWGKSNILRERYHNLGVDYMKNFFSGADSEEEVIENITYETKGKYVFIGDLEQDLHDTYMGPKPGCVILYGALKSLEEGKHIVTFTYEAIWFLIYFAISLMMIKRKTVFRIIPWFAKYRTNKLLCFLFDMTSFGVFLFICVSIEYILNGTVHSIIVPVLYFSLVHTITLYKQYQL